MERAWTRVAAQIWCINLADRPDRFAHACRQFHAFGLCRVARFHRPERATVADLRRIGCPLRDVPGCFGCWRAHRAVVSLALSLADPASERGGGAVLVLEDDVRFDPALMWPRTLHAVADHLDRAGREIDLLYLGHMASGLGFPAALLGSSLLAMETRSALTHAYVLTSRGARRFVDEGFFGAGGHDCVDGWFRHRMRQHAIFPQLATQTASVSSNVNGDALAAGPADLAKEPIGRREVAPLAAPSARMDWYTAWNVPIDIVLCWVAPVGRRVVAPLLAAALLGALCLRSAAIFFCALLACLAVIVAGAAGLALRAARAKALHTHHPPAPAPLDAGRGRPAAENAAGRPAKRLPPTMSGHPSVVFRGRIVRAKPVTPDWSAEGDGPR
jgi:hypothetical protein